MSGGSGIERVRPTSDQVARVLEQKELQHKGFMDNKDSRVYTQVTW